MSNVYLCVMKKCPSCNKERADKFFSHENQTYCDRCIMNIDLANSKITIAERRKYQDLYRKYGITKSEYDTLFKKQKGRCAICKEPPTRIMVDHCHSTNKIRGLLCGRCNTGLGCFNDDAESLKRAIKYLNMS